MYKHKWNPEGDVYRCGWCKRTLPRTVAGRALDFKNRDKPDCDRMSPEKRLAEEQAAEAIYQEIALWRLDKTAVLSPAAEAEVHRRISLRGSRRALNTLMMASIIAGGVR